MCSLTSPVSSTSPTPSFLFHHSVQFFVFFHLFHFFLFKNVVRCHSIQMRGPVEMDRFWMSLTLYHLWRLLLVRLGGYIVNLSDFYS
jgi:hypothetical protein